jgi:hypothetical protein
MVEDILEVQRAIEGRLLAMQPAVERTAMELAARDPELMRRYLSEYSVGQAEETVRRWKALGELLLTRYNDGYVAGDDPESVERGYPEPWLERVVSERPEQFHIERAEEELGDLPY